MAWCSESRYSIVEVILLFSACGANLATFAFILMSRHDNDGSCLLFADIQVISKSAMLYHSSKCLFPICVHIVAFFYAALVAIYWLYILIRGQEGLKFLQVVNIFAYGILAVLLFIVSILITMGLKSLCNEIHDESPRKRDNCRDYQNKRLGDVFNNPGYARFYDVLHNAKIASWVAFSVWFIVAALAMWRCYSIQQGYTRTRLEPDKPEVI